MKILFLSIICFLLCPTIFGQTEANKVNTNNVNTDDVQVAELYLARDNGSGKAGEITESFFTNDIPIYCVVQLDSMKSVTVKMNFVAVKVQGVKPETKVITVSYKTNGKQSQVNFTGTPDKVWTAGFYRIDIFVDDKPAKNLEFEIKKTTQQAEKAKQPTSKSKTANIRKFRKN